jgi:hypothetical protein
MNDTSPSTTYTRRLAEIGRESRRLERRDRWLAALRLVTVVAFLLIGWAVFDPERLAVGWLLAPAGVFIALVMAHEPVARRLRANARATRFYERGLARLQGTWHGIGPAGSAFVAEDHPYAEDLDLFGEGSLYQLLVTAETLQGQERLAAWLSDPAPPTVVRHRQEAVAELAPRLQLREDLDVRCGQVERRAHPAALRAWLDERGALAGPGRLRLLAGGCVLVTLLATLAWLIGPAPRALPLLALVFQGVFAWRHRDAVARVIETTDVARRELDLLDIILARLEAEKFSSHLLGELASSLNRDGRSASTTIRSLRRTVDLLDARRNQLFAPVSALLLWGTSFAAAIEQWRCAHAGDIERWIDAVAEVEALNSLASYRFEHPQDPFPDLLDEGPVFAATDIGHPLMPVAECVPNDVELSAEQRLLIVSGSNMSGKSTLMRTVGINAVLAQAGAPVRAAHLRLSPLQVGGSIRVRDSLRRGMSGFYAEIKRFRRLLELAADEPPLLFLLEEILHTTNSHDRRTGAQALLRSLLDRGAVGLVTTHDLAITALADELPAARNVHFVDTLRDGRIHFDYRLRSGVVQRTNAVDLMREVGLEV